MIYKVIFYALVRHDVTNGRITVFNVLDKEEYESF